LYGTNCTLNCHACLGASYCSYGINGTGQCICAENYNITTNCATCLNNFDITKQCNDCLPTYYGTSCSNRCLTDCNNGTCSTGINGTGKCICNTSYDPTTNCSICLNNFDITKNCYDCLPSYYDNSCSSQCLTYCNNGTCSTGTNGTGKCICIDDDDTTPNCLQDKSNPKHISDWVVPVIISAGAAAGAGVLVAAYFFVTRYKMHKKSTDDVGDSLQRADFTTFEYTNGSPIEYSKQTNSTQTNSFS